MKCAGSDSLTRRTCNSLCLHPLQRCPSTLVRFGVSLFCRQAVALVIDKQNIIIIVGGAATPQQLFRVVNEARVLVQGSSFYATMAYNRASQQFHGGQHHGRGRKKEDDSDALMRLVSISSFRWLSTC